MILTEDALLPWRKKAYERFISFDSKLSLPEPAGKGVISLDQIESSILPECKSSYIVLVDGHLDLELSKLPEDLTCISLAASLKSYGLFLQNRWSRLSDDPLLALNVALGHGAFIYISQSIPKLQILHVLTSSNLVSARLQITAGKSIEATIVQTHLHLNEQTHSNTSIDIAVEVNAQLNFYEVAIMPEKAWFNTSIRATQKKDSNLKVFHGTDGSQSTRFSATTELLEDNSHFTVSGLAMLNDERKSNMHVLVDHAAPHCTSRQQIKMVLNDHSRSDFEGKIYVRQAAQKTQAYQLNNNLILSESAVALTQPNLEIFADDVKASHGATVAQLSGDELFYLQTRGIPAKEAKAMLTHAFCRQLIDELPITSIQGPLLAAMLRALHA
jgi:Fe-S cluster assembly protein SufD